MSIKEITKMRLLVISDTKTLKEDDRFYAVCTFAKFLVYFKPWFESVTITLKTRPRTSDDERLSGLPGGHRGDQLEVIECIYWESVIDFYKRLPQIIYRNVPRFWGALGKVDLVLLRMTSPNCYLVALLALLKRKPYFCYFVGDPKMVVQKGSKYQGLKRSMALTVAGFHEHLNKIVVRKAKAAFFLSSSLRAMYEHCNVNCFSTFSNLISDAQFEESKQPGKKSHPKKILYVGRLSHEKGITFLLEAIALLTNEGHQYLVQVCGGGKEREKLEKLVGSRGLTESVQFLGYVPLGEQLWSVYRNSDIFILPSLSEGTPKVVLEAMTYGLPVLATRVGGIPDIITHKQNGILFSPGSAESIAEALRLVINDADLRNRIARNGYLYAGEHTAEKQAAQIAQNMLLSIAPR